ncbi:DUF1206 domain-containing protein [Neobacillus sp. PS3-34]|uniref:DUF1206 domain-containing protein n=1 Tax=Neobacillus sp. PS3-34 TaxID=3070678 RepID=UPI0027E013D5|nr:DUF1206 domain-containing protein [Neobacillus sp. PS3-34]WML47207.1 DUF1206 domain-containing protein [Neobacillus sp. PS3-34]
MTMSISKSGAKQKVVKANRKMKPWIRRFGRFGMMAKGIVFSFIGILAVMAALGLGGKTTGTKGVFYSLAGIPFGEGLLLIIGIGLVGYIVWQLIKAIKDPEDKGHDMKGIVTRSGYFISAIIYSSLSFNAIKVALHAGSAGGSGSEKTLSAKMLSYPLGQWIVGLVGVVIIIYGLSEIVSGYKEKFMRKFNVGKMSQHERRIARNSGKIGLISRGIVLSMVGSFFIQTAITANPNHTKGLGGALSELAKQPYGQWLLGIVGFGLILYGLYGVIKGRYEYTSFGN